MFGCSSSREQRQGNSRHAAGVVALEMAVLRQGNCPSRSSASAQAGSDVTRRRRKKGTRLRPLEASDIWSDMDKVEKFHDLAADKSSVQGFFLALAIHCRIR